MSELEIIKDNKLIANFCNLQVIGNEIDVPFRPNLQCFRENELKYHSSWDWLMPVIEKIESLGYKWEIGMSSTSPYHYCKIWSIGNFEGITPLDSTYGAIVEFIKWYNSCQKS